MTAQSDTKLADEPIAVSEMNLWQKLAAITGEVGSIAKDGTNSEQKYKFIEYAAVAGRLRELFAKYHVMCIPTMGDRKETEIESKYGAKGVNLVIDFEFKFINADTPTEIETIHWQGEASDYGDKATNKAATAALKYCLMRTFNVSEKGDEDPDSQSPERGDKPKQENPPKKLTLQDAMAKIAAQLVSKGFDSREDRISVMLRIAGVADAKDLTAEKLNHVMGVLETTTKAELHGYLDVRDVAVEDPETSNKELDNASQS